MFFCFRIVLGNEIEVGPGIEPVDHDAGVPGPGHHVGGVVPGGGDGGVQVDLD